MDPALLLLGSLKKDTTESVGFLNDMMKSMWPFINPAVAKMVKEVVEPMFEELLPGPFKSTEFLKIDLGTVPLKFDAIDVIQESKTCIQLAVDVHWDGKCDIELKSPIIGTYGVESVKLAGRLCIEFQPLLPVIPVIGAIQASFINPPAVDLDFTGIADIADVALIRGAIRKVIGQVINTILVLPNRIFVPIAPALDFFATLSPPIGIIRLTVESGSGFKASGRLIKDVPDVYCKVSVGAESPFTTKTVNNSVEPVWTREYSDFLFCDPQQMVHLHVLDEDLNGDDKLGGCIFPIFHLLESSGQRASIPLRTEDGPTGAQVAIKAEVRKMSSDKSNFDTPEAADVNATNVSLGLLTLCVAGVKNIPDSPGLAPYVKVIFGEDHAFQTPVVAEAPMVDPRCPNFNSQFRVVITPAILAQKSDITFELCNMADKSTLGSATIGFEKILNATSMTVKENVKLGNGSIITLGAILYAAERV